MVLNSHMFPTEDRYKAVMKNLRKYNIVYLYREYIFSDLNIIAKKSCGKDP